MTIEQLNDEGCFCNLPNSDVTACPVHTQPEGFVAGLGRTLAPKVTVLSRSTERVTCGRCKSDTKVILVDGERTYSLHGTYVLGRGFKACGSSHKRIRS